jgi:hypothetical protein
MGGNPLRGVKPTSNSPLNMQTESRTSRQHNLNQTLNVVRACQSYHCSVAKDIEEGIAECAVDDSLVGSTSSCEQTSTSGSSTKRHDVAGASTTTEETSTPHSTVTHDPTNINTALLGVVLCEVVHTGDVRLARELCSAITPEQLVAARDYDRLSLIHVAAARADDDMVQV